MSHAAALYLDLVKRCLTNWVYGDAEDETVVPTPLLPPDAARALAVRGLRLVRTRPIDPRLGAVGRDWPPTAHTMIGLKRLDNLQLPGQDHGGRQRDLWSPISSWVRGQQAIRPG